MTRLNLFATMVCAIGVFGLPAGAFAQNLPIGKAVSVTGLDGSRRGGSLVSLDGKTVVIEQRSGTATIPLAEVRTITRPSYAILTGTLIGAGAGFLGGLAVCNNKYDCPPELVGLMYAGIGAGVGAAVGAIDQDVPHEFPRCVPGAGEDVDGHVARRGPPAGWRSRRDFVVRHPGPGWARV